MTTASERGWGYPGAPGSSAERAYRRLYIKTVEIGGIKLAVRREVAHLFVGFLTDLLATGYRLDVVADDWGFANRDIRGRPGVKSNHSWGLAIDINATANPMTEAHAAHAGTRGHDNRGVHTDMPAATGPLAAKWGLRWGANYGGTRKDAMHFEFTGTPEDVKKYPTSSPKSVPVIVPWKWSTTMPGPLEFTSAAVSPGGGIWKQSAEGGIYAVDGAPYLGAYNGHPELGGNARYFVALVPSPLGGYVQVANDGATYRWDPK